jgi:hypothetical protein
MRAGFHTTDITPAPGMEIPGGFDKVFVRHIHDPLKARAAVFDDDATGTTLVFLGVDTCEITSGRIVAPIRRGVEQHCSIPAANVMIAASHTHSGGPACHLLPDEFADAPEMVRDLLGNHAVHADPRYADELVRQCVAAVGEAYNKRRLARLSVGSGREEEVAFNRRFRMKNGRVFTHPGKGNPDIVEPAGPTDPDVGVLAAWDEAGELLGCVIHFACHCTTFGASGVVSADYVHYLERTVQGVMGADAGVVFLSGAAGDVTQVDNQNPREGEFGATWSRRVGTRVGAEALKVLATAQPGGLAPLAVAGRVLSTARRVPGPGRVEECRRRVEEGLRTGGRDTEWQCAKEILILDWLARERPVADVEIQAFQVGPAVFVANPAEYFAESGLAIKRASPFPFTFVVTLANGSVGYVPPEHAFDPETGGGYETVLNSYANLEIGAERAIREASIDLANGFTPGAPPEPPQITEPQPAWSFGARGPERE